MFKKSFASCTANINVGAHGMNQVGLITGLVDTPADKSSAVSRYDTSNMIASARSANTGVFDTCTMITNSIAYTHYFWNYNLQAVTNSWNINPTDSGASGIKFTDAGNYSV